MSVVIITLGLHMVRIALPCLVGTLDMQSQILPLVDVLEMEHKLMRILVVSVEMHGQDINIMETITLVQTRHIQVVSHLKMIFTYQVQVPRH